MLKHGCNSGSSSNMITVGGMPYLGPSYLGRVNERMAILRFTTGIHNGFEQNIIPHDLILTARL